MATKRPKTLSRGRADACEHIQKHIGVLLKTWKSSGGFVHVASFAQSLNEFIDGMASRASNRPGGSGRK